jgi:hypothetical protein
MFYIVASQVKINHMTKRDILFNKPLNNNLVIAWRGGVGLIFICFVYQFGPSLY